MDREVGWADIAWDDLQEVADHISRDSPYYAAAFVREVRDAARSLAEMTERGRIVPEFGVPAIRELLIKRYRLIYQVSDTAVWIIGFLHGARDLRRLWEEKERPGSEVDA